MTEGATVGQSRRAIAPTTAAALAALVVLSAALNLIGLGQQSLWQDEASTWDASGRPLADFYAMIRDTETNGSLYNLLVTVWRWVVGDGELALRLPSALLTIAVVPIVFLLGRQLVGTRAALTATFLVAVSGEVLDHGREARTYALVLFLVTARSLAYLREVERPSWGRWGIWVVLGALAVYAHLHAVLLVVAELAAMLASPALHRTWRRHLAGWLAMGALIAPLGLIVLARSEPEGLQYIGRLAIVDAGRTLAGESGALGAVAVGAVALVGTWPLVERWRRGRTAPALEPALGRGEDLPWHWRAYLVAGAIGPIAVCVVASIFQPVLLGRYVAYCTVPLALLVAHTAWSQSARTARTIALAAATIPFVAGGLVFRFGHENEDWRQVTADIVAGSRDGDLLAAPHDFHLLAVRYYVAQLDDAAGGPVTTPAVVLPAVPIRSFSLDDLTVAELVDDEFACAVAGSSRLWVVQAGDFFDRDRSSRFLDLAEQHYENVTIMNYDGALSVRRYDSGTPLAAPATACADAREVAAQVPAP